MGKIKWSKEAFCWLKEIHDYIALDNPQAASRVIKGIVQKINLLKEHPEIGYRLEKYLPKHVRVILYGHYRIAYEVDQDRHVSILGIFHGSLELEKHLTFSSKN